jgi:hypothetical protein
MLIVVKTSNPVKVLTAWVFERGFGRRTILDGTVDIHQIQN